MKRHFRVAGAAPNLVAFVALGLNNSFPLPSSLTPFGWTNCTLFTNPVVLNTASTSVFGAADFPLVVPNNARHLQPVLSNFVGLQPDPTASQ